MISHWDCITPITKYPSPLDISYSLAQLNLRICGQTRHLLHKICMIALLFCTGEEEVDQANIAVQNASDLDRILVGYQ